MAKINTQKIDACLEKIHALYKYLSPYKEFYDKVTAPVDQIFSSYEKAIKGDIIKSENEDINKLWALARTWKNGLDKISRKDENFWVDRNGLNMLDRRTVGPVVNSLREIRDSLKDIKNAADGFSMLIITISINDHVDIKGALEGLQTTKVLDIEARKRSKNEFTDCVSMVDRILPALNNAINCFHRY